MVLADDFQDAGQFVGITLEPRVQIDVAPIVKPLGRLCAQVATRVHVLDDSAGFGPVMQMRNDRRLGQRVGVKATHILLFQHAGHAHARPQQILEQHIQCFSIDDALLHQVVGLMCHGVLQAVNQEPDDRLLQPQGLLTRTDDSDGDGVENVIRRRSNSDQFDKPEGFGGLEIVKAAEGFGMVQGCGQFLQRQAGCVAGNDRLAPIGGIQL